MSKRFLLIMAAGIVIFAGLLFLNKNDEAAVSDEVEPTSHTQGTSDLGVSVVEYGDFQCPACFSYFPIFSQLKEEYKDRVIFQFRHFPLIQIHQNAMAAHRAAEAAALQGKFWEMHDLLFQNQKSWETDPNPVQVFEGYAAQLELDIEKFRADASSEEVNAQIQADLRAGQQLGISGTPSFAVDGELIETPGSIDEFKQIIDAALAGKQQ